MSHQFLSGLLDLVDDEEKGKIQEKIKIVNLKKEELIKEWHFLVANYELSTKWLEEVDLFIVKKVLYYGHDTLITNIRASIQSLFIKDGYATFYKNISKLIFKDNNSVKFIEKFINCIEKDTHFAFGTKEEKILQDDPNIQKLIDSYNNSRYSILKYNNTLYIDMEIVGILAAHFMFEFCDKMNLFEISKLYLNDIELNSDGFPIIQSNDRNIPWEKIVENCRIHKNMVIQAASINFTLISDGISSIRHVS